MKKISIFLVPIIIVVAIFYGCSEDHVAPTFSQYEDVSEPTNVEATYSIIGNDSTFKVTWQMEDTTGVVNYLVAWSDSNIFDDGNVSDAAEQYVLSDTQKELKTEIVIQKENFFKTLGYFFDKNPPDIDVFIAYFTVSAVYNVMDQNGDEVFSYFIGSRAVVDRDGTFADSAAVILK